MRRGVMNLRLIITTLFVTVMIGVGLFYTTIEVGDNYDRSRSEDFNDTFTSFEENFDSITQDTRSVRNRSLGTSASQETTSGFSFQNAISSLKLVWNFFGAMENLINQLALAIGIPAVFVVGFLMIVVITILLLFLKAIFGVEV